MGNLAKTYQDIADILSFKASVPELESKLRNVNFNWDNIVIEGSKHLVLPAIYCRLKNKNLLEVLPNDLKIYLEEITAINRNRNKSLIKQIRAISKLLQDNAIEHIFLKGSALLISGCYDDIAERMIGDIDILVKKNELRKTFDLIKNNGYDKSYGYAYKTINYRHLDRLISEKELAAIEIHSELLNTHKSLIPLEDVFETKQLKNNTFIPSYFNNLKHLILGWQINDNGRFYNSLNFKINYDIISIDQRVEPDIYVGLNKTKFCKSYLQLCKLYFNEFSLLDSASTLNFSRIEHKLLNNFKYLRIIILGIKTLFICVTQRIYLITTNKYYRKHIYCKIFVRNKHGI